MIWQADLFASAEAPSSPQEAMAGPAGHELRPYQSEAVQAILDAFATHRSSLLVMATGLGKTRVFGAVAQDFRLRGLRTLVTAHSVILVDQAYEALRRLGLRVGIEQADRSCMLSRPDVVIATVQSLRDRRLERYARDHFGLVVTDEAHRALAQSHRAVFDHFASAKVLGVTATPDRADRVGLGNVFESVAFERDMLWGIEHGWLSPLELRTCVTKWDPSRLKTIAGDFDAGSVERELIRSGVLNEAASTLAELGAGRRTVAFLPTVAAARAFGVELATRGIPSGSVDGETPPIQRERLFRDLREGRISVLSNCAVLIEGFDVPSVDTIALLSPTKSRSRLAQCIGRGTRIAPGKTSCLVLDFCPGRLKRGRLASPADALAGKMLSDDVLTHVQDGDLAKAIARAELKLGELEELKRMAEQREAEKRERRARMNGDVLVKDHVEFALVEHDARSVLGVGAADDSFPAVHKARPRLTAEQRIKAGLATEKQAAILSKHGLNPYMRRKLANEAIDAISANKWRLPDHVRDDKRFYAGTKRREQELEAAAERLRKMGW